MRVLRGLSDPGLSVRSLLLRPSPMESHRFACGLLLSSFERAFRAAHDTAGVAAARRHFAPEPGPPLCSYAVRALARPDLAAHATRTERGRELLGAAIDCLAGEGGWRERR